MSKRERLMQVPDSEHPAAPLGGPVEATMIPGVAVPEAGPRVASRSAGDGRRMPVPQIEPSERTGERESASVVLELASPLAAAPGLPRNLCRLRVRSDGDAQGVPHREIQGFE